MSITPSFFYQEILQDGLSQIDSDPGTEAHYQPFDIAEPYSDQFTLGALTANYHAPGFDITSVTARWTRVSTQTQDTSESFENPFTCITVAPNCGELPFYGPNGVGSGPVVGTETDPSSQVSEELRIASTGDGPLSGIAGVFYSDFNSQWQLDTQSQIFLEMRRQNLDLLKIATQVAGYTGQNGPLKPGELKNALRGVWDIFSEFYTWIDPEEAEDDNEDSESDEDDEE